MLRYIKYYKKKLLKLTLKILNIKLYHFNCELKTSFTIAGSLPNVREIDEIVKISSSILKVEIQALTKPWWGERDREIRREERERWRGEKKTGKSPTTSTVVESNGSLEAKRSLRVGEKKRVRGKSATYERRSIRSGISPVIYSHSKISEFPVNYSLVAMWCARFVCRDL